MNAKKCLAGIALVALLACACSGFAAASVLGGPHYYITASVWNAWEFTQAASNPITDQIYLMDDIVLSQPVAMQDNQVVSIDGQGHVITSTVKQPVFHAQGRNASVSLHDVRYEGGPLCDFPEGQFYLSGDTHIKVWNTLARARYISFFDDVEIEYATAQEEPAPLFILTAPGRKDGHTEGFVLAPGIQVYVDNLTTAPFLFAESPDTTVLLSVHSLLDYAGEGAFLAGEPLGELFIGFGASLAADVASPVEAPLVSVAGRLELGHNAKLLLSSPEAANASALLMLDEGCYIQTEESSQVVPPLAEP